jgi:hypothetical protein
MTTLAVKQEARNGGAICRQVPQSSRYIWGTATLSAVQGTVGHCNGASSTEHNTTHRFAVRSAARNTGQEQTLAARDVPYSTGAAAALALTVSPCGCQGHSTHLQDERACALVPCLIGHTSNQTTVLHLGAVTLPLHVAVAVITLSCFAHTRVSKRLHVLSPRPCSPDVRQWLHWLSARHPGAHSWPARSTDFRGATAYAGTVTNHRGSVSKTQHFARDVKIPPLISQHSSVPECSGHVRNLL